MSYAYDRIKWNYLRLIMVKLMFCEQWVNKIMKIVTFIFYKFVNGR